MGADGDRTVPANQQAVSEWIRDHAHELTTVDPRAPLTDLEPLRGLVGDAEVVGLGGSTRGAHELSRLMHRVVRFLVEELGFGALALEEDWTNGVQLDEYVRTGKGDSRALLADAWAPHRTEEILDVVQWMRSHNESHREDPVRFVGVDINSIRTLAYDAVTDYVRRAAPGRLGELETHYVPLRPRGAIADHTESYRGQGDKQPLIDHARRAHDLVGGLPADENQALALHHARVIVNFYEYHSTDSLAYAEQCLAENTIWWHQHTGDKVIRWGGSGHTANAPTRTFSPPANPRPESNAGSYLRDHFGAQYVSIGLSFDHGTLPYPVPPPPPAFADARLGATGLDTYLLDLHARPAPPPVQAWLTAPAKVRLIGPTFDAADNAAYHLSGGSLSEWFDIVVHSHVVTPNRPLGSDTTPPNTSTKGSAP